MSWDDSWQCLFYIVCVGAIGTLVPIVLAFLKNVKLEKPKYWFENATAFEEQQQRLIEHEKRIKGTLVYWKNKAAAHNRLNLAKVIWSLVSAVVLPVVVQLYDQSDWAQAFLTALTVFTGLVVALAHSLKSEEMHRGFRECESDYYDVARTVLDNPGNTPDSRKKQVDDFFLVVERIRKAGRKVETNRPPSGISNP